MRVYCPHCLRANHRPPPTTTGDDFVSDRCDYCRGSFWADRYGQVKRTMPEKGKEVSKP